MGALRVAEAVALFLRGQGGELVVGQDLPSATVIGLTADGPLREAMALRDDLVSDELDTQASPLAGPVGA